MVAAAEQDYQLALSGLAALLAAVAGELDDGVGDLSVVIDIWMTLRVHDPRTSALIGAVAVLQLAKSTRAETD